MKAQQILESINNLSIEDFAQTWIVIEKFCNESAKHTLDAFPANVSTIINGIQAHNFGEMPDDMNLIKHENSAKLSVLYDAFKATIPLFDSTKPTAFEDFAQRLLEKRCEVFRCNKELLAIDKKTNNLLNEKLKEVESAKISMSELQAFEEENFADSLHAKKKILKAYERQTQFEKTLLVYKINKLKVDSEKIQLLQAECASYRNYLRTTIKKACPQLAASNLDESAQRIFNNEPIVGVSRYSQKALLIKLKVLNTLMTSLEQPTAPALKLLDFEQKFTKNETLLAHRVDSRGMHFLKNVAKILLSVATLGCLAPWLFKKPKEQKFVKTINHTLHGRSKKLYTKAEINKDLEPSLFKTPAYK